MHYTFIYILHMKTRNKRKKKQQLSDTLIYIYSKTVILKPNADSFFFVDTKLPIHSINAFVMY
jgi:hypothetical protein